MVIQRMNNVLVKHSKVLFGVFTAVIIVSFVWFFTPGVDGSLLFGGGRSDKSVYGTVFEEKVTFGDLKKSMRELSLAVPVFYNMQAGQDIPEEYAFYFSTRKKMADKFGLAVSDKELSETLLSLPAFQENGKFSKERYDEYEKKFLEPMGYGKADLESAIREFIRVNDRLGSMVSANVALSDAEFKSSLAGKLEKFSFRFIQFSPEPLMPQVEFDAAELREFFDKNAEHFLPPAKCSGIAAVALNKKFKAVIPPEIMKAYYEKNKEAFKDKDGKVKPFAAVSKDIQSLLEAADPGAAKVMDEFYKNIREAARTEEYKTNAVAMFRAAAEKAGLDLVELKDITQDDAVPTSKKLNGADFAVARALTALKNPGSVTNRVRSANGVSVALLTDRQEFKTTTFEEAAKRVEEAYRYEKAKGLVASAAEKFRTKMKASAVPGADLEKTAKECGGNLTSFPEDVPRYLIDNNPNTRNLRPLLFETAPGNLSSSEKQDGFELMVFVDSRTAPSADELAKSDEPGMRAMILMEKKQNAIREFDAWVNSNCRIVQQRNQERQN